MLFLKYCLTAHIIFDIDKENSIPISSRIDSVCHWPGVRRTLGTDKNPLACNSEQIQNWWDRGVRHRASA